MNTDGRLIVFSGPSGAGKGTVLAAYFKAHPETAYSVSATTRAPRPGEKDGVDYHFVTRAEFEAMIASGGVLEYAEFGGNYYGSPSAPVLAHLAAGRDVILEIEVQGARQVMAKYPDALSIFVLPPSFGELKKRLTGRGTETSGQVAARLAAARREIARAGDYDYVIVNDCAENAAERLHHIICAQKYHTKNHIEDLIKEVLKDA